MGHPMLCTELSKSHPMQANEGDPTFIVVVSVVSVTSLDCCYHYQKTGSKNKGKEKCVAKKKNITCLFIYCMLGHYSKRQQFQLFFLHKHYDNADCHGSYTLSLCCVFCLMF